MNLNDTKSSETLRKEISQDLDRLDNKVEHLKGRLTPGQIIDDAIFSPYRSDLRAGFSYLRNNPIGSSFLAIGTLLLMDNDGESYEQYLRSHSRVAYSEYKGKVTEAKNRVSETMGDVTQEVRSRTQSIVERGEEKLNQARDTGRNLKNQVGSMTDNIREKMSRNKTSGTQSLVERGEDKLNQVRDTGRDLKNQAGSMTENIREKINSRTSGDEIKNNVIDATENFKERAVNAAKSADLGINVDIDTTEVTSRLSRMKDSVNEFGRNSISKIKEKDFDSSLTYVALGGSLGFVTGGLIPMRDEELSNFSSDFDFTSLRSELESAANESMSVFKNELIDTLKNASIDIF